MGLALFDRRGLVFAGRRINDSDRHWQMPQGGVDEDETPEQAALRELHEEIGTDKAAVIGTIRRWLSYDLPPEIADRVWGGRYRGQRQRWFALRFAGGDADIRLDAHRHVEFGEWRWMELARLPQTVIGFKRAIYAEVAAEFARFAVPAS